MLTDVTIRSIFIFTVPPDNFLFGGTEPPNNLLFGGTVPPNNHFEKEKLLPQAVDLEPTFYTYLSFKTVKLVQEIVTYSLYKWLK